MAINMIYVDNGDTMTISGRCTVSDIIYEVSIPLSQYNKWHQGYGTIQDIMPDFTDDQREFLISGLTPAEWNELCEDYD